MDPRSRIEEIFNEALDRPRAERSDFLERRCAEDQSERNRVEALLRAHDELGEFLISPDHGPDESKAASERPDRVAQYELRRHLGSGGMGEVWLAEDPRLGQVVALKFLDPHLVGGPSSQRDLLREAKLLAQLDNPHIVPLYQLIEDGESQVLVMGYMKGGTLRDRLARATDNPISTSTIIRWGAEIAEGLAAAHERGVLHRDIKPDNIFLTDEEHIRIGDFGIAQQMNEDSRPGRIGFRGTPAYMSPEQLAREDLDERSDLFALGATLYELTTSVAAYSGTDRDRPRPLTRERPETEGGLADLITCLMEIDPHLRPRSAEGVATAFRCLEAGQPAFVETGAGRRRLSAVGPSRFRRHFHATLGVCLPLLIPLLALDLGLQIGVSSRTREAIRNRFSQASTARAEKRVAVLPLSFSGSDVYRPYGSRMAEMLGYVLAGARRVQSINARAIMDQLQARAWMDPTQQQALALAQHLKADLFVNGKLLEVAGQLQVHLELHDAEGRALGEWNDRADAESEVVALVDRLGGQILQLLYDDPVDQLTRSALASTTTVAAWKAFLEGEEALRAYDHERAQERFGAATREDSTFAIAYYRLAELADEKLALRSIENAVRESDRLPYRLQKLIAGYRAELFGDTDEAERQYQAILLEYPDDIEASERAAILNWDHNGLRGRSMTEAIPHLETLFDLDPDFKGVFQILRFAYIVAGNADGLERACRSKSSDGELGALWSYVIACGNNDLAQQELWAQRANLKSWTPRSHLYVLLMIGGWPDNHENVLRHLTRVPPGTFSNVESAWISLAVAFLEAGRGRLGEALVQLEGIPEPYRLHVLEHEALLLAMMPVGVTDSMLDSTIQLLESWPLEDPGHVFDPDLDIVVNERFASHHGLHRHLRFYLLTLLNAKRGELEAAREYVNRLDALPAQMPAGVEQSFVPDLKLGARAYLAFVERDLPRSLELLGQMRRAAGRDSKYSVFGSAIAERYLRALVLEQLGRTEEAISWYTAAVEGSEFGLALAAPAHLQKARIYEGLNRADLAQDHYRKFVELYGECDATHRSVLEDASRSLARLEGL